MKLETEENLMRRYLLGDLPEPEATGLEEKFFTDEERFEQVWEVENHLVDGYVRGRLSPEDRERFERHYLASPVHRQRVTIARELIEEADKPTDKAVAIDPKVSFWARLSEKLEVKYALWQFALIAAVLLLTASSLWLFFDRANLRREVARLRAETETRQNREQTLTDQIAAARDQSEKLKGELEQLRAGRVAATPAPQTPLPTAQTPRANVFSFLLSAALVRGGGDPPPTLTIPPKTDAVRLQMPLGEQTGARRYRAVIRTVEGRQVWVQQSIKPHVDGTGKATLAALIPAGKLSQDDYILTLSSINSTGELEEINRYFFRVIRR